MTGFIPSKNTFISFGWTAVLAILASLVVARLLTPMMAAYILKPHKNSEHADPSAAAEAQLRLKLSDIAGARFTVGPPDSGVKMQLVLKSDDAVALLATAQQVERELRTLQGVGNVSSSASLVRPDSARAADPSFRSPMAIAVISGLITSTLLSLLVVPAVFTYIDDLAQLIGRGVARLRRVAPVKVVKQSL